MCALPTHGWAEWSIRDRLPWSVRASEDVMVVDPERGVLNPLGRDDVTALGPLLDSRALLAFDGSAVKLTTAAHESVATVVADLGLLRSALTTGLADQH